MTIPVGQLSPFDQWDQTVLDKLFSNTLYPTGLTFQRTTGYPNTDGCVLVVPGKYWQHNTDQINDAIARFEWLLFVRASDEEDSFDIGLIDHPNVKFWVQYPRADRDYGDARLLGVGFAPSFKHMDANVPDKTLPVFLSAQDTHERRHECFKALGDREGVWPTSGFTKGLPSPSYVQHMLMARVAPAPSGVFSPDSFRLYEALEAHCVPIADDISPVYDSAGYWRRMFDDAPFPVLTLYSDLVPYIDAVLSDWSRLANRIAAWWMLKKREIAVYWLRADLKALGAL